MLTGPRAFYLYPGIVEVIRDVADGLGLHGNAFMVYLPSSLQWTALILIFFHFIVYC